MLICRSSPPKPFPNIPPKRVFQTGAMGGERLNIFEAPKALEDEPSCGFNGKVEFLSSERLSRLSRLFLSGLVEVKGFSWVAVF